MLELYKHARLQGLINYKSKPPKINSKTNKKKKEKPEEKKSAYASAPRQWVKAALNKHHQTRSQKAEHRDKGDKHNLRGTISIKQFANNDRAKHDNLDLVMTMSAQNAIAEIEKNAQGLFTPSIMTPKSVITVIPTVTSGNLKPISGNPNFES